MKDYKKLYDKAKELIVKQDSIINFISFWGKFAELLQLQPESGRLIAYLLSKSRKLKSELHQLEAEIEKDIAKTEKTAEEMLLKNFKEFMKEQHPALNINWVFEEFIKTNYFTAQFKSQSLPKGDK